MTLTATLENAPDSHGREKVFTLELRFNEEFGFSYQIFRDDALRVTNGTVIKARRLTRGSNLWWEIHVDPASNADVTVVLRHPVRNLHRDGRKPTKSLEFTVSGPGLPVWRKPELDVTPRPRPGDSGHVLRNWTRAAGSVRQFPLSLSIRPG